MYSLSLITLSFFHDYLRAVQPVKEDNTVKVVVPEQPCNVKQIAYSETCVYSQKNACVHAGGRDLWIFEDEEKNKKKIQ